MSRVSIGGSLALRVRRPRAGDEVIGNTSLVNRVEELLNTLAHVGADAPRLDALLGDAELRALDGKVHDPLAESSKVVLILLSPLDAAIGSW